MTTHPPSVRATLDLTLCDIKQDLTDARVQAFAGTAVRVVCGSITETGADALVSPANSFGFMDGGIDLLYSQTIGWHLQKRVQEAIQRDHDGELLVGQALAVPTDHDRWPWLISAPTMRIPGPIDSVAVYLSTRAALRQAITKGWSVVMPGMGTLTGRVPPDAAALAMRKAYDHAITPQPFPKSFMDAIRFLQR